MSAENQDNNKGCLSGCLGAIIKFIVVIAIIGWIIGPYETSTVPTENKQNISMNGTAQTSNGIYFHITDYKYTNEFALRQVGIPMTGDSLVLVICLDIQNNSNKPYNTSDVKGQLIDNNGAIYEGGTYKSIYEMGLYAQQSLNPGKKKTEYLIFKIPKEQDYIIELQDGSILGEPVLIKL